MSEFEFLSPARLVILALPVALLVGYLVRAISPLSA
jgi:hypothetical protein